MTDYLVCGSCSSPLGAFQAPWTEQGEDTLLAHLLAAHRIELQRAREIVAAIRYSRLEQADD
jgi:hypothetical protein